MTIQSVRTAQLEIAYTETGPRNGWPVVLSHGFPYDPSCFHVSARYLAVAGARVLTPWIRGYGPTRFLSRATPRSGEQAALGADLLAFMDAMQIERAVLGGFDWGGREACVVAALWPERVSALVSAMGYNIIDPTVAQRPASPDTDHRRWYVWYFQTERGRVALEQDRAGLCRLLWELWSPSWRFSQAEFDNAAAAFDNPDFVDVVIHSYRHRCGNVPGDPALASIEAALADRPVITAPTVVIDGADDGVAPPPAQPDLSRFIGPLAYRVLSGVGHNPPQEDPRAFGNAVLAARELSFAPSREIST